MNVAQVTLQYDHYFTGQMIQDGTNYVTALLCFVGHIPVESQYDTSSIFPQMIVAAASTLDDNQRWPS